MDYFSEKDSLSLLESYRSLSTLESHIKKFRVSGDFSIAEDSLVEPNEINIVKIRLEKLLFPQIDTITP